MRAKPFVLSGSVGLELCGDSPALGSGGMSELWICSRWFPEMTKVRSFVRALAMGYPSRFRMVLGFGNFSMGIRARLARLLSTKLSSAPESTKNGSERVS